MIEFLSLAASYWPLLVGALGALVGGIWGAVIRRRAREDVAQAKVDAARAELAIVKTHAQAQAANAQAAQAATQKAEVATQTADRTATMQNDEMDALAAKLGVLRKDKP